MKPRTGDVHIAMPVPTQNYINIQKYNVPNIHAPSEFEILLSLSNGPHF